MLKDAAAIFLDTGIYWVPIVSLAFSVAVSLLSLG
jgi:hypothetical protein